MATIFKFLSNLCYAFYLYVTENLMCLVFGFEYYLYETSYCPAFTSLLKNVAESYGIIVSFLIFFVGVMLLLTLSIRSYVRVKERFNSSTKVATKLNTRLTKSSSLGVLKAIKRYNPFK